MFTIYLNKKLDMLSSIGSFIIAIKLDTKIN